MDINNTATATKFYDSHGGLWETCETFGGDAEAFGPTGIARRILDAPEADWYTRANAAGRVVERDGWSILR